MRAGEYPWYAPEIYELSLEFIWLKPRPPSDVPDMIVFSESDDSDSGKGEETGMERSTRLNHLVPSVSVILV